MITSLPNDVIFDIIARVPRCNYPVLSLVSKHFYSLVASPELYGRRILLGCTEACIYAMIYNRDTNDHRWYILHCNHLLLIPSLPPMPSKGSFVSVGSRIYALGGIYDHKLTSKELSIDCRSHTLQPLSSLPMLMTRVVVDIIDKKIYVIGNRNEGSGKNVMVVFNTNTQMWEPGTIKSVMESGTLWYCYCVVMDGKLYIRDYQNSFVFVPKESKWELDETINSECWDNACVIDDVLYKYHGTEKKLRAYDPKEKRWVAVKGVEEFGPDAVSQCSYHTVSYSGKLAVFLSIYDGWLRTREICVEIAVERRLGGEIWGKVEWCDIVLNGDFSFIKSIAVMV